jgi:CO/xanthine dehydrogenase Mo-binding subunit
MKSAPRKDATKKIDGSCRFLDDYNPPGMLHGYLLYATIDKGKINKIVFPTQYQISEFTIVAAKDIPGVNIVPEPVSDQPFLIDKQVEHFGQVIFGIAHHDPLLLKNFIKDTIIEYQQVTAIIDSRQCLDDKANLCGSIMHISHKDENKEDAAALQHQHDVFYTQHQEQAYLETQGMLAEYLPDRGIMKVTGTMQCPFFVQKALINILGTAVNKVEVETSEGIGGAFGGKEDFPNLLAGITALLSLKSKRPVKIVLDRYDDLLITTKRHPARVEIDSYTNRKTGRIQAMNIDFRLDAGAFQTLSPVVLHRGILHATGGYCIPRCEISGFLHKSNTPPNGAFRGFGAPQAIFALEAHLDNIANKIGVSPLQMRLANVLRPQNQMPSSQKMKDDHLMDCLKRVIEISQYEKKSLEFDNYNASHSDKKGIGLVLAPHGGGYTGNGEKILKSKVKLKINSTGDTEIFVANVEMGQGAHTTLAQMVNEELGIPLSKVLVQLPNTSKTPDSGPTVASRTIYIVGTLLQKLAKNIKSQLKFDRLEDFIKANSQLFPREFEATFIPDPKDLFDDDHNQGIAYHDFSWAASVVEICYDPLQYKITVDKIWNVLDIGRVINYDIALGQVYGGITQAFGWALTENIYKKGFPRSSGFTDYILPSIMDIPNFQVEFIHTNSKTAKGLGEIPMDYPAPALRNALLHATGIMINDLPLTPERIYHAISGNAR